MPTRFYTNRPGDIQEQFKDSILLSNSKWIGGTDCAVEISLAEDEISNVTSDASNTHLLLYTGAIPISRVVKVHFKDKKQSETTQWNINNGTAYLPSRLLSIDESKSQNNLSPNITEKGVLKDSFPDNIRRFDMLLGSVSFLNVAKPVNSPFARDYFTVVGYFNSFIKAEFQARVNAGVATYDDRLTGLYKRENGWSDVMRVVTEDVDYEVVKEAAEKAGISLAQKFGLIDIERIPRNSHVYILALLATYGLNKPKGVDELVGKVIADEKDEQKAEEIAAIFGLHLRYSRLRNSYKGKSHAETKFLLDTRFDYYVIESIFQFVFNSKVSAKLEYIDKIMPEKKIAKAPLINSFRILDVTVPVAPTKPQVSLSVEPVIKKLPDDDKMISEAIKVASPKMQESLIQTFTEVLQSFAKDIHAFYQLKIKEYEHKFSELNARVLQNDTTSIQEDIRSAQSSTDSKSEELRTMEFNDLKKLAKKLKIPKDTLDSIKPTMQGIHQLIDLIKSNDLFYSR